MWTDDQRDALLELLRGLGERYEVEETLGRCYGLRATETAEGTEYTGKGAGGWIRVRYDGERALAVLFVRAP